MELRYESRGASFRVLALVTFVFDGPSYCSPLVALLALHTCFFFLLFILPPYYQDHVVSLLYISTPTPLSPDFFFLVSQCFSPSFPVIHFPRIHYT